MSTPEQMNTNETVQGTKTPEEDKGGVIDVVAGAEGQVEEIREKYQQYIDQNRAYFQVFAKDTSVDFVMGKGFMIDFESGKVHFDTNWFVEHGFTEDQITWAVYHELCHFRDLAEDPEGLMKNFEYIRQQAKETGRVLEQKYEDKFGQSDPDFVAKVKKQKPVDPNDPTKGTMSQCDVSAYKYHHTFFNIFDDIYVNSLVAKKSPRYVSGTNGGNEVARLYSEKLFTETDYTKLPRHLQFLYKLLREEMVPDEEVQISDEVKQVLESRIIFQGKTLTPKELVDNFLKPISKKDTKASTRYFILKSTLEPIFEKLLQKDLEEVDLQKPQEGNKGGDEGKDIGSEPPQGPEGTPGGEGREGEDKPPEGDPGGFPGGRGGKSVDPFERHYKENIPDPLDEKTAPEWIDKEKRDKEAREKKEAEDAKTPEQREKEIQEEIDKKWCEENGVSEAEFSEYQRVKSEIEPYLEELSVLWRDIIYGKGRESWREMEGHYKTGTELDIAEVINKFPEIEKGNLDSVRVMNREVEKQIPVNRPDLIRVRLVADMSGSMDRPEKMKVLRQCFVLLLSSLKEFDSFLNISRSETKTKMRVDTEAWTFGHEAEKIKAFRADSGEMSDDTADIIQILNMLVNPSGNSTMDNLALEAISDSLKPQDIRDINEKKIMDIVFEITDGGSSDENSARVCVDGLSNTGVITRAFQIGMTDVDDKKTFNKVWNDGREEPFGEIVGSDIKNLIPAVVKALKKYLGNVRI